MIKQKQWRSQQKKAKWAQYKAVLAIVRTANKIPVSEKDPPAKGRKRKAVDPPPVYARISIEDDEEDGWSEGDDE